MRCACYAHSVLQETPNVELCRDGMPRQLGRYELLYELASGGMATVYLGRTLGAESFSRPVAVKVLHPHLARNADFRHMFRDEARIASRINHPNVCSVIDYGVDAGRPFLVMDFLMGESLAVMQRRVARLHEHLPQLSYVYLATKILVQACEGLHAAHETRDEFGDALNIVHRDISPQNIYVAYDGGVRVLDFGVARSTLADYETRSGAIKGKFSYMAPEQLRDKALDRRVDVWALGVNLWESLCLRRLFRRSCEMQTIFAVLEEEIPDASLYNPYVPAELDHILHKAMCREPAGRYASARDFGRDLACFLAQEEACIDSATLSEWMLHLFAEEQAHAAAQLRVARQFDWEMAPVREATLPPPAAVPVVGEGSGPRRVDVFDNEATQPCAMPCAAG